MMSCKDPTIPVVSVTTLPAELVALGADSLYDTIPYQITRIEFDTITPDSIVTDTLVIDTFRVDSFFMDTIRLCGKVSYEGKQPFGPALREVGFCVDDYIFLPVAVSTEQKTPESEYGDFSCVLVLRNTMSLFVYAYAVNPVGEIRGERLSVRVPDFDKR